jgi:hypothetical protein
MIYQRYDRSNITTHKPEKIIKRKIFWRVIVVRLGRTNLVARGQPSYISGGGRVESTHMASHFY